MSHRFIEGLAVVLTQIVAFGEGYTGLNSSGLEQYRYSPICHMLKENENHFKICVAQCLDAQDLNDNITTCEKDGDRDNVPTLRQSLMVTSVRKECFQDKMICFCVIEGLLFMMRIAG